MKKSFSIKKLDFRGQFKINSFCIYRSKNGSQKNILSIFNKRLRIALTDTIFFLDQKNLLRNIGKKYYIQKMDKKFNCSDTFGRLQVFRPHVITAIVNFFF